MIFDDPVIQLGGDHSIKVCFGDERSLRLNKIVRRFYETARQQLADRVVEFLTTYSDVTIFYRPLRISHSQLISEVQRLKVLAGQHKRHFGSGRLLTVPVCYEGEYAPDMEYICDYNHLEFEEAVAIHTASPYFVFQLGFTPGAPFIGPLQEALHVPLMQTPRTHTPEGAVSVSIGQTVIYPRASPGGMRLIGRTPVRLFQVDHPQYSLFKPGDWVKFEAISRKQFKDLHASARNLFEGVKEQQYGEQAQPPHPHNS